MWYVSFLLPCLLPCLLPSCCPAWCSAWCPAAHLTCCPAPPVIMVTETISFSSLSCLWPFYHSSREVTAISVNLSLWICHCLRKYSVLFMITKKEKKKQPYSICLHHTGDFFPNGQPAVFTMFAKWFLYNFHLSPFLLSLLHILFQRAHRVLEVLTTGQRGASVMSTKPTALIALPVNQMQPRVIWEGGLNWGIGSLRGLPLVIDIRGSGPRWVAPFHGTVES